MVNDIAQNCNFLFSSTFEKKEYDKKGLRFHAYYFMSLYKQIKVQTNVVIHMHTLHNIHTYIHCNI